MEDLRKATIIEGVASTSHRDSQGETLDLDGADISPLLEGRGFVNSDHSNRFEHLVGRVLAAKKIKDLGDCETPSQIKYYTDIKKPFIWTQLELWDGHGHKEADAISSIYKFYQARGEHSPIKLSVEGKTLERGSQGTLKRTLIKGVAITVHPANKTTRTEVTGLVKSAGADEALVKSETDSIPMFIEEKDPSKTEKLFQLAMAARNQLKELSDLRKAESIVSRITQMRAALGQIKKAN